MGEQKQATQLIWGLLLVLAGVGVVFRLNSLESELDAIAGQPSTALFIRICIYVMAILLIGGGIRKIRGYYKNGNQSNTLDQ